jgi:hypothetical protein
MKPLHPAVVEQLDAHAFAVVLVESTVVTKFEFTDGIVPVIL